MGKTCGKHGENWNMNETEEQLRRFFKLKPMGWQKRFQRPVQWHDAMEKPWGKRRNMICLHGIHLPESRWRHQKNQALNEEKIWRKANMFFTMLSTRMTGILWCTVVAMLWFVNKYVLSSWNPGIFIPQNLMLMYSVHHISILRCLHLLVRMEKNIDNIDWMHGRKRLLENRDTGPWHVSFKIYTGLLFFPEHASLDNSQHNSGYCYMGVSINGGTF